ncbi:hypothetical protein [Streptomyces sp. NPDC101234]|uniref:hypothetical protein n=1 Tax=Streptomyces sp. NPDC101234 TaxID=3366138 RepID=UPI003807DFCB
MSGFPLADEVDRREGEDVIFPFVHDGAAGTVTVAVELVDAPEKVGKPPGARGFPSCSASVEHPAQGYRAMFGWVQLVQSTDSPSNGTAFETDPFFLFEDASSPYAFFGVRPTLFDAPSRVERTPLAWLAHSFLAWTPFEETKRSVVPLTGFSWGFDIDDTGRITPRPVRALAPDDWDTHRPYLGACHPGWSFEQW